MESDKLKEGWCYKWFIHHLMNAGREGTLYNAKSKAFETIEIGAKILIRLVNTIFLLYKNLGEKK